MTPTRDSLLGWHFSTGVLAHGDGRKIRAGVTHHVKGPVSLCSHGLHASPRALDALDYAPPVSTGLYVARVRLHGEIVRGDDKAVATDRTYLWVAPADLILHEFACECAEAALMIGQVEDERSWNAIAVKRDWMAGKATDEQLAGAWNAARDAAWDATRNAARDAMRDAASAAAARDAARNAAWVATSWDAARDAARGAARAAAWAAAWDAARSAACAAAWDAASADAAWTAESDLLESLLLDRLGKKKRP